MSEMPTIFLSRLVLDPGNREVQRAIADCHALHQTVMRGFPTVAAGAPREALGVLYRPELDGRSGAVTVLVQSAAEPDWAPLRAGGRAPVLAIGAAGGAAVKRVDAAYRQLAAGQRLRFRLRANPTKRLSAARDQADPDRLAGKRVALLREEEQLAWLERKLVDAGARLLSARTSRDPLAGGDQHGWKATDRRDGTHRLSLHAVVFDGDLLVTDPEALRAVVRSGIGSGKAYGFGLLSLGPA